MTKDVPRLYLDTADIMVIADGKVAHDVVERLHSAMAQVGCALIVSVNHPWDFYPRTDQATKDRIIDTLTEFPLVLVPDEEPQSFERSEHDDRDLVLKRTDIRALLEHPSAVEALGVLDPVTTVVHDAEQSGLVAARATRDQPLKKAELETYTQVLVSMIRGNTGIDAHQLLAFWEERNGRPETDDAREAILGQLQPVAEMLKQLRASVPDLDGDQLVQMIRENEDPTLGHRCPGLFMQRTLRNGRRRNLDRNSKRSDLVDIQHVQYLPYVDIFTTDKENVAVLTPLLAKARRRRPAKLMRNMDLDRVSEELLRL